MIFDAVLVLAGAFAGFTVAAVAHGSAVKSAEAKITGLVTDVKALAAKIGVK